MIEKAIVALLTGDAAVEAIVGTRVYPQEAEENAATPKIVYAKTGGEPSKTLARRSGLVKAMLDLRCTGHSQEETRELSRAVRLACDVGRETIGGVDVQSIDVEDETDDQDPGKGKDGRPTWSTTVQIAAWYRDDT